MIFYAVGIAILFFAGREFHKKNNAGGWKILAVFFALVSAWLLCSLIGTVLEE